MTTIGGTRPRTDRLAWLDQAACRHMDPATFFPGIGGSTTEAREACSSCPVIAACLEEAIATPFHEDHGIRGGTSRIERKKIRQNRRNRTT